MISSVFVLAETVEEQIKALQDRQALDSQVLTEQFYFWTVVVMWLIHAGFMAYEAGAARRKNVMSTAMKNILTIAVVTPTFYYFGWYTYGCFQEGWPKDGHNCRRPCQDSAGRRHRGRTRWARTSRITSARSFSSRSSSSPGRRPRSCPGADRARPPVGLPDPGRRSRLVRLDPRRGLGLELRRLAHDPLRLPRRDRLGGGARRCGRLRSWCAPELRPPDRQVRRRGPGRTFRPHNTHLTLMGLMLIFTGFYGSTPPASSSSRRRSPAGSTSTSPRRPSARSRW